MKNKFICPVCGYPELEEDASTPYHTYEICPCCFSQSGFDLFPEFPETIIELRIAWIRSGARWQSKILKKYGFLCDPTPRGWDAIDQMRKAGFFSVNKMEDNNLEFFKVVCAHCRKEKSQHKAYTFECPKGTPHKVLGYLSFGPEVFEPKSIKLRKPRKKKFEL